MEGLEQPALVDPRARLHAVVVGRAEQLPAVERQRFALIHAAGDAAVSLDPVRGEEAEGVERVEVER